MSAVIKNPGQLRMMCYKAEIVLGIEAWYFLHGTTGGVCNIFYFLSLLSKMQTADVQLGKRGQSYTVKAGQADGSLLGLSREWRIGRKAVRRLLDDFAGRGIIAVESNPLTSLISLVCVKSWLDGGRLVENPMFHSAVGKFEGVRIHLLNGQQFGTLRRSSQRVNGKTGGKGRMANGGRCIAADMDSSSGAEVNMPSATAAAAADIHSIRRSENTPVLPLEDMPTGSVAVGTIPPSDGTIQPPAEGTTSDDADTAIL